MSNGLYATDTDGLPKTDFKNMELAGFTTVLKFCGAYGEDMPWPEVGDILHKTNGREAGAIFFAECAGFESVVKSADYNVFDYSVYAPLSRMLAALIVVYQTRLNIRGQLEAHAVPEYEALADHWKREALHPSVDDFKMLVTSCVEIAILKDKEYGASWCKRGGIGAWFTVVRKFDRLNTQLKNADFDIWDVAGDVKSTESLEETLLDAINYLLLIKEKIIVIKGINIE